MSSHPCQEIKMSVAVTAMISSISRWIRAKRPMGRSVGLGLCPQKNLRMWKRRRMLLAEIPMPISERRVFLKLELVWSPLFSFILCGHKQ